MCGIAGFSSREMTRDDMQQQIKIMTEEIIHRGPDAEGFFIDETIALGHRRLAVVDLEGGTQPMTRKVGDNEYTLIYNGELYNTEELRYELENLGHKFRTNSDTEVLLIAYIEWGENCLVKLNGIFAFAIWDKNNKKLFLARDRFGVKPLFYSLKENEIIFGSEIKTILAHKKIEAEIDENGLAEIISLAPTRTPGFGVFKNIMELLPAHYLIFNNNNFKIRKYWQLESKEHFDNLSQTAEKLRVLFKDAVNRQLVSDVPLATLLSGGLDSSSITAIAAKKYSNKYENLETYSFDYKNNELFFKNSKFQPQSDNDWVNKVRIEFDTNHRKLIANTNNLLELLEKSVIARDLPGMADIDSSLYYYCSEIKRKHTVVLSGECADEILGGYPWFHNEVEDANNFPWVRNLNSRLSLFKKDILFYTDCENYMKRRYAETIEKVPKLAGERPEDARRRELFYLNITWFMANLLERKDRMSMANGLEVRVPFADHNLVQYIWNIPWEMKMVGGMEKGIFRLAMKGILPEDVLNRKKSPYPKTHNPDYEKAVKDILLGILNNPKEPLNQFIDKREIKKRMNEPSEVSNPFFGQLMSKPQMLAFLIQVNFWLNHYKVKII